MQVQWPGRRSVAGTAVAVAWVLCTALLSAGCWGGAGAEDDIGPGPGTRGGDAPGPLASVRGAADVLADSGTSRATTSMLMTSGGTRVAVGGSGAFDYGRRVGRLKVRLPEPGSRRPVTELVAPGSLYMKNRGAGVPADKWVRVDVTALPDGNLVTNGATDPVSAAELLRGARYVSYKGERTLDMPGADSGGVRVRHYRGTLDLAAAAAAAGPRSRGQLAAAAHGFSEDVVPFDAYIDGQGRLRKVRHRFTFVGGAQPQSTRNEAGNGTGGGAVVSSTTWFHGFGAPVKVVMPEPDTIYAGRIASS